MLYNKDWDRSASNPVSDALLKAANLLEKHGHVKGIRMDESGSMCFIGALQAAQGVYYNEMLIEDSTLTKQASKVVANFLGLNWFERPDARFAMADWNNDPKRTGQEVIDVMRMAASSLVNQQEKMDA